MKAPAFTYHAPRSIPEVVGLLSTLDNARVLGGGQSLMPMLNLRVAGPDHLIDLGRVAGLIGIEERDDVLAIGAMTTQRAVERSELVRRHAPLLGLAVDHVGHQQTRNRGTLGGSLCHLDPGAELPVAAAALNAVLVAEGANGRRRIEFADFPAGYLTNALEPDEILVEVEVPKAGPRSGTAFLEFNRRPADFAIVSVAVQVCLANPERIGTAAISVGGLQYAPVRLHALEASLVGEAISTDQSRRAHAALVDLEIDGDELYPADYRREICGVLIERALKVAIQAAGGQL